MCEGMSLVDLFDNEVNPQNILINGSEQEFMRFAVNQEECRIQWLASNEEYSKLKKALDDSLKERSFLESKLQHARKLIDLERKRRRRLEEEKRDLEGKITLLRSASGSQQEKLNCDTKTTFIHPKSKRERNNRPISDGGSVRTYNVMETTDSILSDLLYSQSEDDLNSIYLHTSNTWKKMRPSLDSQSAKCTHSSLSPCRSRILKVPRGSCVSLETTDCGLQEAPINVICNIESKFDKESKMEDDLHIFQGLITQHSTSMLNVSDGSCSQKSKSGQSTDGCPPPDLGLAFEAIKRINSRQHCFTQKIVIKFEECNPCGKRINFGKMAIMCGDCKVVSHPVCKEKILLPCIPSRHIPKKKMSEKGSIADYVPMSSPMVPSIVIHCVNEIESRGLTEVGIYRIPGSVKKIKSLKEKFLEGKGAPNLGEYDIHVVCGVLKDFLWNLGEPLITRCLWSDFARAAQKSDTNDSVASHYQAISELPKPNQDTLAYLILHLQKVASCRDCKMTMENLAKVFGPSISGNSCINVSLKSMYEETNVQHQIIESLMKIPSEYWLSFINKDNNNTPCNPQSKGFVSPLSERTPPTVKEKKKFSHWKAKFFLNDGDDTPHRNRWKGMNFFNSPK